jgi:site-specific DNA-methyltransferase (adenine-specific)
MRELDEASVDAVVCDPPYGLEFMGKDWDAFGKGGGAVVRDPATERGGFQDGNGGNPYSRSRIEYGRAQAGSMRAFQEWCEAWAVEALRVLKPGGHLLAFGGTRTYHRLACAVEDAGFEIRDSLIWLYGSGFPKSLDVSKAIDKAAGAERESRKWDSASTRFNGAAGFEARTCLKCGRHAGSAAANCQCRDDPPATPEAVEWQGWGTALKPSHEPVVVARKPLSGTVAANVLAHGTGALNVDGCRVQTDEPIAAHKGTGNPRTSMSDGWHDTYAPGDAGTILQTEGRWPANVILSPDSAVELDEQSGERPGMPLQTHRRGDSPKGYGIGVAPDPDSPGYGDTGGASRFFYCAKASRGERNAGLEGFDSTTVDDGREIPIDNPYLRGETARRNTHPTVKPIDLMRWLCRLVTPPGGTVLDPFTGSGTTGVAAHLEGFDFIGCEREAEYATIARARIEWWSKFPAGTDVEKALGVAGVDRAHADAGQTALFP